MRNRIALLLASVLLLVPLFAGCGNSASEGKTDDAQVQEETAASSDDVEEIVSYDYVTENGKFTKDAGTVLENIDKRMEGVCTFHVLQDGPSVAIRWVADQDVMTAVSCAQNDGQTPIQSADEIPGGLIIGTQQAAGETSEFAINGIVYVLQTLNADLASDGGLYDTVKGMVSEADAMKEDIGEGGLAKGTIGDFNVTLLTQDNEKGMLVMFIITER